MAGITTRSVLSGITGRPINYEVGEALANRGITMNRKVGSALAPTPQQQKAIPSQQKRPVGGRTF